MDSGVVSAEVDFITQLRESVENQWTEIQDLIARNGIMAEALGKTNGVPVESLKRDLEEKSQLLEFANSEKANLESKASMYRHISSQQESALDLVLKVIVEFGDEETPSPDPNIEAEVNAENESETEVNAENESETEVNAENESETEVNAENESETEVNAENESETEVNAENESETEVNAENESETEVNAENESETEVNAENESETEVNRLLVLLGEEQRKVERLSERVIELGGDVEELLKGIGGDSGLFEEESENNDPELVDQGEELEDFSKYFENNDDDEAEVLDEGENNDNDPEEENEDIEAELLDEDEKNDDDDQLLEEEIEEVDNSGSNEDSSVESLLVRISNVDQPDDRRNAMDELVNILAYSSDAVLAFGVTGILVLISVLKEEHDDTEMVKSTLQVLNNALILNDSLELEKKEFQDTLTRSDLFSREADNISLVISFLEVDDFLVKLHCFGILSQLITIFPNGVHEVILNTRGAITKFMDMISDSSARRFAMTFLVDLTRGAKEIQNAMIAEGVFEKIFALIEEDGESYEMEVYLGLLNSFIRENTSNQMLLKQTIGFEPLLSILKLESVANSFSDEKSSSVLAALDTVTMLLTTESSEDDSEGDSIKTTLFQENLLDDLLILGVESQAPVEIRCSALKCIGDLISGNLENCDALARKVTGEEQKEPALNSILRIILTTSNTEEFIAADYIFKNFCEGNSKGQATLASTSNGEESNESFASMLLKGFSLTESEGELEICGRAAIVLSHILKDNNQCKEKALGFNPESSSEPLMLVLVKRLAVVSSYANKPEENSYVKPALLKLLVVWFFDFPEAVKLFLGYHPNASLLLDLLSNESESALTKCLAALVLGETLVYNDEDPFFVLRAITRKVKAKLSSYFPIDLEAEKDEDDDPVVSSIFDAPFTTLIKSLEEDLRGKIEDLYSNPKSNEALVPTELDRKNDELDSDYLARLKEFSEKQYTQIQGLSAEKEAMSEKLAKSEGVPIETLVRDLHKTTLQLKLVRSENEKFLVKALMYREISDELDVELKKVKSTFSGIKFDISPSELPDMAAIQAKALGNSLSVLLGYEQSRAEKLSTKLGEFGENVEELLRGIVVA